MAPKPFLLLDIDGVCLNWEEAILAWIAAHRDDVYQTIEFDEHSFDLESRLGLDRPTINQLVQAFHHSDTYQHLQPMRGAQEGIARLRRAYQLVAITACGTSPATEAARRVNLNNLFGDVFEPVHCVANFAAKRGYLNRYPPSHWVEDHGDNAVMGLESGHTCWLINASYNKNWHHAKVNRVDNLIELADLIL